MRNKKIKKSVIILGLVALVSLMVLVVAQTQQELEAELAQLELDLVGEGYGWLVNYSVENNIGIEVFISKLGRYINEEIE